ncbi:hypothetical protein [Roseofilum reptotaenium]|uniref:hypothetical protein n=1 Tax=Roseofilum reptotaenium TaxID=1233427 RepID=UPI00232D1DB8|nr:hypothetical protein [Roseofilum reptotaenium]
MDYRHCTTIEQTDYSIDRRSQETHPMETITIQVGAELAQAYRTAEPQQQEDAAFLFHLIIQELLNPKGKGY